jgi:hypothetical protein
LADVVNQFREQHVQRLLEILSLEKILQLADSFQQHHGKWPKSDSGVIGETEGLSWCEVDNALCRGDFGQVPGYSLAKLLADKRGIHRTSGKPLLSVEHILAWADEYHARWGTWPNHASGAIEGTRETWKSVELPLYQGLRGLLGGSSLAKLLSEKRDVRNGRFLPRLSIEQVLVGGGSPPAGGWPNRSSVRYQRLLEKPGPELTPA